MFSRVVKTPNTRYRSASLWARAAERIFCVTVIANPNPSWPAGQDLSRKQAGGCAARRPQLPEQPRRLPATGLFVTVSGVRAGGRLLLLVLLLQQGLH